MPAMRQQLVNLVVHVAWHSGQYVLQVSPRIMTMQLCRLQQAHHHGSTFTGQLTISEEPRFSAHRPWAHQILNMVDIDLHCAVILVSSQFLPAVQTVVNGFGRGTAFGHALTPKLRPSMQILAKRFGPDLPDVQSLFNRDALCLALDLVQRRNALRRLRTHRTQVV